MAIAEYRIKDLPVSKEMEQRMAGTISFFCSVCDETREAIMFESGLVFDHPANDTGEECNPTKVIINGQPCYQNVYWIPGIRDPQFRTSRDGKAFIETLIGHLHNERFHGLREDIIRNNN